MMSVEVSKCHNFATATLRDEEDRVVKISIGYRGLRFEVENGGVFLLVGNDLRDVMAVYLDVYNESFAST